MILSRVIQKSGIFFLLVVVLTGCASPTVIQRKIDGEKRAFLYQRNTPLPVENEWAKVQSIGPLFVLNTETKDIQFMWGLTLTLKIKDLKAVSVYDVTTEINELVISQSSPAISPNGNCHFESSRILFSKQLQPWLFTPNDTEKIFKIVMENSNGRQTILYQPCVISAGNKGALFAQLNKMGKK